VAKVLVIGDTHFPAVHPGYLAFCRDLRDKYKCDTVVHIGDVCDFHAISFHPRHPEAKGPTDEYESALTVLKKWEAVFPKVKVCLGNHDCRVMRLAESVNIPEKFLRSYADLWQTKHWEWNNEYVIDETYLFHGVGSGGIHPAFTSMQKLLMSVVQGHIHSASGIKWRANPTRRIFGLDVGCGVDDHQVAFAYGQRNQIKSMLSAGVVLDGIPQHFIMPCGTKEKYNKKRFK
jgi:predicted phosphodiesterase